MRIYLDMCCFNRPYDDQSQARIKLESDAKLDIQQQVRDGIVEMVWSTMLDLENDANPYQERRDRINAWRPITTEVVELTEEIIVAAEGFEQLGIKPKDSLHLSCAISGRCEVLLTTDDRFLKKRDAVQSIGLLNPLEFVLATTENNDDDD